MMTPALPDRSIAAASLLALLLVGCTTTGMGGGELNVKGRSEDPVLFSWRSDNGGINGQMVATLPDATFQGPFFQITRQTARVDLLPLWNGWRTGWVDWPYWTYDSDGTYAETQFITRYSGKVVANLSTPAGRKMRCRLHLVKPAQGMAGGGEGECQIDGAGVIHAKF